MAKPNRIPPTVQVPTYRIDSQDVEDAYQAFAALQRLGKNDRQLGENKYFCALQDTAYARFLLTFEAL